MAKAVASVRKISFGKKRTGVAKKSYGSIMKNLKNIGVRDDEKVFPVVKWILV